MYKGKPLVRMGNTLYYGRMQDPYVVMLQVLSTKEVNGLSVADKVQVQLMSTDPDLRMKERIIKKSEKNGLYSAMDIAQSGWNGLWKNKKRIYTACRKSAGRVFCFFNEPAYIQ